MVYTCNICTFVANLTNTSVTIESRVSANEILKRLAITRTIYS